MSELSSEHKKKILDILWKGAPEKVEAVFRDLEERIRREQFRCHDAGYARGVLDGVASEQTAKATRACGLRRFSEEELRKEYLKGEIEGYQEGVRSGYAEGFAGGHDKGQQLGHDLGYQEGVSDMEAQMDDRLRDSHQNGRNALARAILLTLGEKVPEHLK